MNSIINTLAFPHPPRGGAQCDALRRHPGLLWLTLATGERVPAIYRPRSITQRQRSSRATRTLILYSHGNAEDLANLLPLVEFIGVRLDADVLAYEYPGYSISDGSPSEKGVYAAATAAYEWAVRPSSAGGGGAEPHEIVPFGRSIGSAPACHMASTAPSPVGGLILQSPLLSGANAILGRSIAFVGACADPFKNYNAILNARCQVAICHGTADGVVPCWNGRKLHQLVGERAVAPLWCEGRGHNDMDEDAILRWARAFLDGLAKRALLAQCAPLV